MSSSGSKTRSRMRVRRRLRDRLAARGYSHKQVAKELGITAPTFSLKMNGAAWTEDEIIKLCDIADMTADQILFRDSHRRSAVYEELIQELEQYPPHLASYLTELVRILQLPDKMIQEKIQQLDEGSE